MHLRVRFIGKALEFLESRGHDDRRLMVQVSPELIHVGDLLRHPLFPGRNIYVVAREVDLVDRCVTVWVDELPGANRSLSSGDVEGLHDHEAESESAFPATPFSISD